MYHIAAVTDSALNLGLFVPSLKALMWTNLVFKILPPFLFCLKFVALIKIKSHIDILQGISKLDHLVKVSIFQIFKDFKIQKVK